MRNFMLALLPILSTLQAVAEPREREAHPRGCSASLVDQCVLHYRRAGETVRSWLAVHELKVRALEKETLVLQKSLSSISQEKSSIASDLFHLREELGFLRPTVAEKGSGLLGNRVSIENLFRMHPLHRGWRERYPSERAEKLSVALANASKKESDLNARIARIEAEKTRYDNEFQSAVVQKNSWLAETRQYEQMCNSGCRERVCPSGN